tara:strand:+ start:5372 stop:7531 length:2160 start_codon:yes stop_codon:yes gene_type:complete
MKVGIVRYPGSNCDNDMMRYFCNSVYIWHKEDILEHDINLLVLPGGFAFGDRYYKNATGEYIISPGKMAVESPVTKIIYWAVKAKIPILGVCNGFQILTQLGLLPGTLGLNSDKKFTCKKVKFAPGNVLKKYVHNDWTMQVANSYGKYYLESDIVERLEKNNQIFLKYDDSEYDNGSIENIAGICSENHLIYGMMPHPERSFDKYIQAFFSDLTTDKTKLVYNQFHNKISDLMNSEHISYKSTRKYLKKLYTNGSHVIQGPGENAGIIDIGDGYCLALRIESHNHPIFIDPYQGAATGVGGILRDIFTMGARPIAIFDFLRFGTDANSDKLLEQTVKGIADYGNCFGVANMGGNLQRSEMFNKNPLLNVGCIGIVKKENIIYGNVIKENSYFVYVGSKTGSDGVNGACMASNEFSSDIDISSMKKNIQKGDPFLERLLLEACSELADMHIIDGMQDMGAGGLLCSSLELIQRGREKFGKNFGCDIYVDKIPTKYDMDDVDKLISESQERMLLVVKGDNLVKVMEIFNKWDLQSSVVGIVNLIGKYRVVTPYNAVSGGGEIKYEEAINNFVDITQDWEENNVAPTEYNIERIRDKTLWEEYDTTIGGRTIKGPQDAGSYSIISIYENNKKLLVTWGKNIEECLDKVSYFGAHPKAVVNCLNFGNPQDTMGDFANTVDELRRDCEKYDIPVVGGNVSLYNATDNKSIAPTPILLMVSLLGN